MRLRWTEADTMGHHAGHLGEAVDKEKTLWSRNNAATLRRIAYFRLAESKFDKIGLGRNHHFKRPGQSPKSSWSPTHLPFSPTTTQDPTPGLRMGVILIGFLMDNLNKIWNLASPGHLWLILTISKPIFCPRIQLKGVGQGSSWWGSWWPISMKFEI